MRVLLLTLLLVGCAASPREDSAPREVTVGRFQAAETNYEITYREQDDRPSIVLKTRGPGTVWLRVYLETQAGFSIPGQSGAGMGGVHRFWTPFSFPESVRPASVASVLIVVEGVQHRFSIESPPR